MLTFFCPFISITFMWSNIQICHLLLPNYIWYIFLCLWEHWAKNITSIATARKVRHSWNFIIDNSRPFSFKSKDLLLQKVLIKKFLEDDGMRVLSRALFSSCMIGYNVMKTLSWQKFLLLQRSQSFVRKNLFYYEQTENISCAWFFCVWRWSVQASINEAKILKTHYSFWEIWNTYIHVENRYILKYLKH